MDEREREAWARSWLRAILVVTFGMGVLSGMALMCFFLVFAGI